MQFKPLHEITPFPTKPSVVSIASTANEATTPIELSSPEAAIDNAIKTPQKNDVIDVPTENAVENSLVEPKPVEIKKPMTHKVKERAKKYKKRHANTKHTKPAKTVKKKYSTGINKK